MGYKKCAELLVEIRDRGLIKDNELKNKVQKEIEKFYLKGVNC